MDYYEEPVHGFVIFRGEVPRLAIDVEKHASKSSVGFLKTEIDICEKDKKG